MLDWQEVEELHAGGVRIEGHTETHPDMRTISVEEMTDECNTADDLIEERLGRRPEFFAYPFGFHGKSAREFARPRYRATVTTELGVLGPRGDTAAVPRLDAYYLRSEWMTRNFQSVGARAYFRLRSLLRNLRGSQCRANSP